MKATIIGAGIAGLSAGIALKRAGMDVEVYESAPELRAVGAGIWMAPNAMQVFEKWGIADKVLAAGWPQDHVEIADWNLDTIQAAHQKKIKEQFGWTITGIHRARLQQILLETLGKNHVHTGRKFIKYANDTDAGTANVVALFANGKTVLTDILIGADGIHSAVRKQMHPGAKLRYSGQTCWRGVTEFGMPEAFRHGTRELWGKRLRFGFSVISANEVYWFAVATEKEGGSDSPRLIKGQLLERFAQFGGPVADLIGSTDPEKIIRNDLHDLRPLKRWSEGRVLLIGDAAHAMTPNMGQGGAQAVEDAWVLGRLIEKGTRDVYNHFEKMRRKKVNQVVKQSWQIGKVSHMTFAGGIRNFLFRRLPASLPEKQMMKLYTIDD